MTDRLSEDRPARQHPEIGVFDPHGETTPESRADDFDPDEFHDADTEIDLFGDGPDDEPNAGAVGLPCTRGPVHHSRPAYSLCAVKIERDQNYPETTDDPDYFVSGQELVRLHMRSLALAACDGYALQPSLLKRNFKLQLDDCTHLVVNDANGREVCRRPILAAA